MGRLTEFFGYYNSKKSYAMLPKLSHLTWTKELDQARKSFGKKSLYDDLFTDKPNQGMSYTEFSRRLKEKGFDTKTAPWDSPEAEKAYFEKNKNKTQ